MRWQELYARTSRAASSTLRIAEVSQITVGAFGIPAAGNVSGVASQAGFGANAARIQGTVDLRVKFRVDGSVEVLEIVHGLPGLNDSALAVARGIKFLPAASDYITLIHVRFELF